MTGLATTPHRRARQRILACACTTAIVTPAVLAIARWPQWWTQIAPEQSAMTWLQSVLLVVAGITVAMIAIADRSHSRIWLVLAAGFGGLALDERFTIHERVRDDLLAPHHVSVPFLPWVAPGDFLLLTYGLVGLILLPSIVAVFRADRTATRVLIIGAVLAAVAVGVDSINPATWTIEQERIQQSLEECVELASDLSLLTAILLRWTGFLASCQDTGGHSAERPHPASDTGARLAAVKCANDPENVFAS